MTTPVSGSAPPSPTSSPPPWRPAGGADEVASYERELVEHLGFAHVVATSSGTTAIHTALAAAGIGPGDEVLVPALAVVMSAAPVLHLGARPVVVDSTPDATGFDLRDLARKTTERTTAILPVYLWGRADPAADHVAAYARTHGLRVIVDACQALSSTAAGRQIGLRNASAVCFSTHELKILSTGEGGFLATDDPDLAAHARAYRSHWLPSPTGPTAPRAAHNFRLAGPLGAIGRRELARLPQLVAHRRALTAALYQLLADSPHLHAEPTHPGWNGYSPLLKLHFDRGRDMCARLAACGVTNSTGSFGLIPLDQRALFHNPDHPPCPNAAAYLDAILAVALTPTDDEDSIRRYADTIQEETARWASA